jgi:hypothetical protein
MKHTLLDAWQLPSRFQFIWAMMQTINKTHYLPQRGEQMAWVWKMDEVLLFPTKRSDYRDKLWNARYSPSRKCNTPVSVNSPTYYLLPFLPHSTVRMELVSSKETACPYWTPGQSLAPDNILKQQNPIHSLPAQLYKSARFQVLTARSMKFRVFWDVAPCSHVEADNE